MNPNKTLAIIGGRAALSNDGLKAHVSFAKIVEAFSKQYKRIVLSCPVKEKVSREDDYPLPDNVIPVPQPDWQTTFDSFRHLSGIKRSYKEAVTEADHIFIRGNPVAAVSFLYKCCVENGRPVCHWLVGNPMAVLQSHQRYNLLKDTLSRIYIRHWEKKLLQGRDLVDGSFLCNGQELADRYPTPKTKVIVSTTLTKDDFFQRVDTCQNEVITLLCLCYIRPEKGIEFLLDAFSRLNNKRSVRLFLAGSRDRYPGYQTKLNELILENELTEKVRWLGHVRYYDIHALMVESDMLILPTLSEGTPRVLVEARSKGLPVVSTTVGGIPTSVTNGKDGILVPAKDPEALAAAVQQIIRNGKLRRELIQNGYDAVREMTLNRFVASAVNCFID